MRLPRLFRNARRRFDFSIANVSFLFFFLSLISLLAAWLVYLPGLSGPFLFDDWANLPVLGYFGPVDNWPVFWRYITAGIADPTGRPIAQLSFLLDAHNWPADPYPFKRTNLLLHLLNGLLLYRLILELNLVLGLVRRSAHWVALLAAAAWLLHPLWVSTVLYVVQRQALLVATWSLLAMLGYLHGRKLMTGHPVRGLAWMSSSLVVGTLLAFFSKANGSLLPLLMALMELVLLQGRATYAPPARFLPTWRVWRILFFALPASAVAVGLLLQIPGAVESAAEIRSFTLLQRVLTQPRILLDYLQLIFFPRPYTTGLFNDAYPFSTDPWHPWTTLPAMLIVAASIVMAWRLRKRFPVMAFSLLFFFSGHLVESTVLPLELYFEHRNYVPSLFLFWPLSWALVRTPVLRKPLKVGIAATFLATLALFTWLRADLWGNGEQQAYLWARLHPSSPRAQTQAALYDIDRHRYTSAARRLEKVLQSRHDSVQAALNLISARCALGSLSPADMKNAEQALADSRGARRLLFNWVPKVLSTYTGDRNCEGLDEASVTELLEAAARNPQFQTLGGRQDLTFLRGRILLHYGHPQEALDLFKQTIEIDPKPEVVLELAAGFARKGYKKEALELLRFGRQKWHVHEDYGFNMQSLHEWILHEQGYWEGEFLYHEKILNKELGKQ